MQEVKEEKKVLTYEDLLDQVDDLENLLCETKFDLEKAKVLVDTIYKDFNFDDREMSEADKKQLVYRSTELGTMIDITFDYICNALQRISTEE